MVRLSPDYVDGRLFRHVADRSAAPRDYLVQVSGRTSEWWFRSVFFCQGGRIAAISAFDVETYVFRLGRLQREEAGGVDVGRACFVAWFDRDGDRVHERHELTCSAFAKECTGCVLRLQGRLTGFQTNDLLAFHYGHCLRVEESVHVSDYFHDLRR